MIDAGSGSQQALWHFSVLIAFESFRLSGYQVNPVRSVFTNIRPDNR